MEYDNDRFGSPLFGRSIDALGDKYLGSARVVEHIIRDFAAGVLTADSEDTLFGQVNRTADILAGVDPSYTVIEGWTNRSGLGAAISRDLGVDDSQPLIDIVRTGLATYAETILGLLDLPEDRRKSGLDMTVQSMVSLFLGTSVPGGRI